MSPLFIGGTELVWIAIIIGILLFGAKKLPELARSVGRSKAEFKKGLREGEAETQGSRKQDSDKADKDELMRIAQQLGISTEGKTEEQIRQDIKNTL